MTLECVFRPVAFCYAVSLFALFGAGCVNDVPRNKQSDTASDAAESTSTDAAKSTRLFVTGVVRDSMSGKPIPGAHIYVWPYFKGIHYADVNGRYVIDIPNYIYADYKIHPAMGNYGDVSAVPRSFVPDKKEEIDFTLSPISVAVPGDILLSPDARYIAGDRAVKIIVKDKKTRLPISGLAVIVNFSNMGGKTGPDGVLFLKGIATNWDKLAPQTHRFVFDGQAIELPESQYEYLVHSLNGYTTEVELLVTPKE